MTPRASEPPIPTPSVVLEDMESKPNIHGSEEKLSRPSIPRRSTDPNAPVSLAQYNSPTLPLRPRTRSPYARTHLRTHSSASSLSAPPMTRAHSSPVMDTSGHIFMSTNPRPSSPLGPPSRRRSPLLRPSDEQYSSFTGHLDIGETISENSELELTPRAYADAEAVPNSPSSIQHILPRNRRRPASPLHHISQPSVHGNSSPLRTSLSSPSLTAAAAKFNEPYPSNVSFSSSSMPSTPTSFRSRSPSISSLETIPDSPYAEEAAEEANDISRLEAAAEKASEGESVNRRPSLDAQGRNGGGMVLGVNSFGVVYGGRDKRKRWSVCGAERRGDLDLETIWED
ncbi:hypothetical protein MMC24_002703 [Lignoscripta atroalba]|nr:hypothetical protein [Lignoscripta atroalba]